MLKELLTREGNYLQKQAQNFRKMPIGQYISIITLNVNRLNAQTKRDRPAKWIQKQISFWLQETHFRPKDTYRLKMRGWKNMLHVHGYQKKASIAILISGKINLKIKTIMRD